MTKKDLIMKGRKSGKYLTDTKFLIAAKIESLLGKIKYWKELRNLYPKSYITHIRGERTRECYLLGRVENIITDTEIEVTELIKKEKELF